MAVNALTASNLAAGRAGLDTPDVQKYAPLVPVGEQWVQRVAADYTVGLNRLLPTGAAWPRDASEPLQLMVAGLAQIWGDVVEANAALLLVTESDPRTTNMLLPDWERNWGLPDNCLPFPPTTISGRENALVARMTLLGSQNKNFFIGQATALGQNISVREYAPYMCGVSRVGDTRYAKPYYSDDPVDFRWQCGDPINRFWWLVNMVHVLTGIECIFRREKPAHTDIVFTYSSTLDRADSVYPWLGF